MIAISVEGKALNVVLMGDFKGHTGGLEGLGKEKGGREVWGEKGRIKR